MDADTYKVSMSLSAEMLVDRSILSWDMFMNAQAVFDVPNQQMQMSIDISTNTEDMNVEFYLFPDYVYLRERTLGLDEEWLKMPVNEELLDSINVDTFQEEMRALDSPSKVKFLKQDELDGSECYVIEYIPNKDYLREYASKQQDADFEIDLDKIEDIFDLYKKIEYTAWIDKENILVRKMDTEAELEFTNDFARFTNINFKNISMDFTGEITIYDYNEPVSIILPEEAENAIDMTYYN